MRHCASIAGLAVTFAVLVAAVDTAAQVRPVPLPPGAPWSQLPPPAQLVLSGFLKAAVCPANSPPPSLIQQAQQQLKSQVTTSIKAVLAAKQIQPTPSSISLSTAAPAAELTWSVVDIPPEIMQLPSIPFDVVLPFPGKNERTITDVKVRVTVSIVELLSLHYPVGVVLANNSDPAGPIVKLFPNPPDPATLTESVDVELRPAPVPPAGSSAELVGIGGKASIVVKLKFTLATEPVPITCEPIESTHNVDVDLPTLKPQLFLVPVVVVAPPPPPENQLDFITLAVASVEAIAFGGSTPLGIVRDRCQQPECSLNLPLASRFPQIPALLGSAQATSQQGSVSVGVTASYAGGGPLNVNEGYSADARALIYVSAPPGSPVKIKLTAAASHSASGVEAGVANLYYGSINFPQYAISSGQGDFVYTVVLASTAPVIFNGKTYWFADGIKAVATAGLAGSTGQPQSSSAQGSVSALVIE